MNIAAQRRAPRIAALCVFACAFAIAWPSLHNPFVLDDVSKIVNNPDIRSLEGLASRLVYPYSSYQVLERNDPSRPVVFATFALNYALGGVDPFGYHVVNALLHALCGVFVFFWVLRLWRSRATEKPGAVPAWTTVAAPAAVALLFVWSPVNVGTSIYVYARSDLLSAACVLGATLLYARGGRWAYAASLVCFALALFAKQSAAVLPALLWLTDAGQRGWRSALRPERLRRLAPFALGVAAFVVYRLAYFGTVGDVEGRGNLWPTGEYALAQPWVVLRYAQMLIAPVGLSIDHQILPDTLSDAQIAVGAVCLAGAAAGLAWLVWRARAAGVLGAVGALWFAVCLAPTSSFFPTVDVMVERRAYLASAGFYAALVALVWHLARRFSWRAGVTVALAAVFGAGSLAKISVHGDSKRLWGDVIRLYPTSVRGHNNLANVLVEEGRFNEAREIFEKLIQWNSADFIAHNNIGNLYNHPEVDFSDETRAIRAFEAAVALNEGYAAPHYNLGRIYQQRGDRDAAERHYLRTLEIQPAYALAHNNLGLLYFHEGRRDDARARYLEALRIDPHCGPAKFNLALLERTPIGAEPAAPSAQRRPPQPRSGSPKPSDVLAGRIPQPGATPVPIDGVPTDVLVRLYEDALQKQPDNAAVRRKYADFCRARKRLECAREQYRKLLLLDPSDAATRKILDEL